MKKQLVGMMIVMMGAVSAMAQERIQVSELPEAAQQYLTEYFKTDNYESYLVQVRKEGKNTPYRVYLKKNSEGVKINMVFNLEGNLLRTGYNYLNTGDLPLEVMMAMQEYCGEDKVKWMVKSISGDSITYKVGTENVRYTLDDQLQLVKTQKVFYRYDM